MSWEKVTLGELLTVKHGWAFKSQHFEDEGRYVVVTPGNFFEKGGFKLRPGKDRSYSGQFSPDYMLRGGDLIVAMTEQGPGLLGSAALIPEDGRFLHNQRIGLVSLKDETRACLKYLYHLFNTAPVRGQLSGSATGTKVRHTAPERIYRVEVSIPDLPTQERIAGVLSAYDDLIDNNRRRIALLEQAARLLYREWFVHFRFPGYETAKFVDGLPEGWKQVTLKEMCSYFSDGDWLESKDQGGEDYRILQISNVGENEFVETNNWRYITEEKFKALRCTEVVPGDLLLSRMPTPIGRAWLVTEQNFRMVTAVDVTIARPEENVCRAFLLHQINTPAHLARCLANSTGATRPRISRKNMGALPMILPPKDIQEKFAEKTELINAQKTNLITANDKLAKARDLLLPRLMDGRLPIPE